MQIREKTKNNLAIGLSFSAILFLLFFSLAKNLWQKKEDQKKEAVVTQPVQEEKESNPQNIFKLISPEETEKKINQAGALLIDLRPAILFEDCHIESSVNFPPEKLNSLSNTEKNKQIIIIDNAETINSSEKITELIGRGFQISYLDGGFEKYQALGFSTISFGYPDSPHDMAKARPIDSQTLQERIQNEETFQFLDVREKTSFESSHISGSVNVPLEELEKRKKEVPLGKIIVVDTNPLRSFQAAVRLFDMHFIDVLYLSEDLTLLKK